MTHLKLITSMALLGAVLAAPTGAAQSRSLVLNAPSATDLRPVELTPAPAMPLANENREAVAFSWASSDRPSSAAQPEAFEAHSRQFQRSVDAAALANGITVTTDGPGAIIRLSSPSRDVTLNADLLTLQFANGRRLSGRAASDQLVSGDDLRAAGMAAPSGALGLRLAPELGSGPVVLRYGAALPADAPMTIWVFDRNSSTLLTTQSAAGQFLSVGDARSRVELLQAGSRSTDATIDGTARAPNGAIYALRIDSNGVATFADPKAVQAHPGLWEWHFRAQTRSGVQRMVKTAFAVGVPVARFDNSAGVDIERNELRITLGAEVKSAGRYEARGTLLATDRGGRLVPVMVGAAADWLEAGHPTLTMRFDASALKDRGLQGPYALHGLTLSDQSRMALLERRADALTF